MRQNPTVKETQDEILILLCELDRVCRKNNIKYSLHGGTLLGAVRDGGFIPWDDDADITMMREEYNRLVECFNKESKDFMLIESFLHMPRIIRRKFDEDTVFAWVDIMIYDPITEKNIPQKIKFGIILAFQAMCRNEVTIHLIEGKTHSALQMAAFKFAYFVGRPFSYEKKYNWYNAFCRNCLCGNRKYIHRSNDQLRGMKMLVPVECMNEYIDISYEGKQLMITKDYDKVLTISYGANYMTPIHDEANDDLHVHFREAFLKHLNLV